MEAFVRTPGGSLDLGEVLLGVLVELGFALFAAESDGHLGVDGVFGFRWFLADRALFVGWLFGAADVFFEGFELEFGIAFELGQALGAAEPDVGGDVGSLGGVDGFAGDWALGIDGVGGGEAGEREAGCDGSEEGFHVMVAGFGWICLAGRMSRETSG